MFKRFFEFVKGVLNKLIGKSDIQKKLNIDVAVSGKMQEAIELWTKMYENNAPWINEYTQSLNLSAGIASEVARMITLEFESEITGSARGEYLNEQYHEFLRHLRRYTEYGCAKGGVVFKPYPQGDKICVDVVQADRFFPTSFDSTGNITGAVFVERITKGKSYYTRLEIHSLTAQGCVIANKAYVSDNSAMLGRETSLENVAEWSSIESEILISNVHRKLFGYYKVAQANVVDSSSPLGESVFSRAIDIIKQADKQYSRLLWEFEGSELAVEIDRTLFDFDDKKQPIIPKGKKRLYRTYSGSFGGDDGASGMKVFSPQIRDESIINGLNELFMRIEDICSLSRGTFSNVNNDARTATELKIMRQRTYSSVKDNQRALQTALEDLIYSMNIYATLYELAPAGEYDVSFNWDDSVIIDAESEREKRMAEVSAGIIRPEVYLAETRGITEEEARKLLPNIERLTAE